MESSKLSIDGNGSRIDFGGKLTQIIATFIGNLRIFIGL
jgi:hypothetical protein